MARADGVGKPNQGNNIGNIRTPKTEGVRGPDKLDALNPANPKKEIASTPNESSYFDVARGLGLSQGASKLLADLTAQRFDGKLPPTKGRKLDKTA